MSISRKNEREIIKKVSPEGGILQFDKVINKNNVCGNVRMYAKVVLGIGAEVDFHTHTGESESFYILNGTAEYNDDGKITTLHAGDYTNTTSGHGHSIKNIGYDSLEFMALIIMD